jgi:hypothetical protein
VSQVFIGAAFFASAHERRYRDAFIAQGRDADAVACARAQLKLIAQGVNDLVNPAASMRVRKVIDDLFDLAAAIAGKVDVAISDELSAFAAALDSDADTVRRAVTFTAIDRWVRDVARFCVARDPQLDIAGALPSLPAAAPLNFVRPAVAQVAD